MKRLLSRRISSSPVVVHAFLEFLAIWDPVDSGPPRKLVFQYLICGCFLFLSSISLNSSLLRRFFFDSLFVGLLCFCNSFFWCDWVGDFFTFPFPVPEGLASQRPAPPFPASIPGTWDSRLHFFEVKGASLYRPPFFSPFLGNDESHVSLFSSFFRPAF